MRFWFTIALMTSAAVAQAQNDFEAPFRDWAFKQDMEPAMLFAFNKTEAVAAQIGVGGPADMVLPILSISMTLGGQCLLWANDKGVLDLEAPIGSYLGWEGPQGQVTLSHLLTHTAGFVPDRSFAFGQRRILQRPDRVARLVDGMEDRQMVAEPGAVHVYSNDGHMLIERVAETVIGEPLHEWCAANVPILRQAPSLWRAEALSAVGLAGAYAISAPDLAKVFQYIIWDPSWPSVDVAGGVMVRGCSTSAARSPIPGASVCHLGQIWQLMRCAMEMVHPSR